MSIYTPPEKRTEQLNFRAKVSEIKQLDDLVFKINSTRIYLGKLSRFGVILMAIRFCNGGLEPDISRVQNETANKELPK